MGSASPETIIQLFQQRIEESGPNVALRFKRNHVWSNLTFSDWLQQSTAIARWLIKTGIQVGDRIALMAATRYEWPLIDMGILMAGAITVPIYPTATPEQVDATCKDASVRLIFAEELAALPWKSHDHVPRIVLIDSAHPFASKTISESIGLEEIIQQESSTEPYDSIQTTLRARIENQTSDDIVTIVYTSGTSSIPKGVMLTHGNFMHQMTALAAEFDLTHRDEQLLFLPLAHIFGKLLVLMQLKVGYVTSFAENMGSILENMAEVEPTFFGSVPRMFEKVQETVLQRISHEGQVRNRMFQWALRVGKDAAHAERSNRKVDPITKLQHRYSDKIVLSKIRDQFGSRLRFAISGGAPLSKNVAEWFHACGVLVLEAYGLTETTGCATINRPHKYRFGTVGQAIGQVDIQIAEDGEILVRGPNVMLGYFNQPDASAQVFLEDEWFRTGDIGRIDSDNMLVVTDRKKDILVTSGGKNIGPEKIEQLLRASPWIRRVIVVGDNRPYLVALVVLEPARILQHLTERKITGISPVDLHQTDVARALIASEIELVNQRLAPYEMIRRFAILPRDLDPAHGELTPTLKIKRKVVEKSLEDVIEQLYAIERPSP